MRVAHVLITERVIVGRHEAGVEHLVRGRGRARVRDRVRDRVRARVWARVMARARVGARVGARGRVGRRAR